MSHLANLLLHTTDGDVTVADYRGKDGLVLFFYPKDDSYLCTKQAAAFRDASTKLNEMGAKVLGVSSDGLESHRQFIKKHDLNFPLVADEDRKVRKAFKISDLMFGMVPGRATVIMDHHGEVKRTYVDNLAAGTHAQEAVKEVVQLHEKRHGGKH